LVCPEFQELRELEEMLDLSESMVFPELKVPKETKEILVLKGPRVSKEKPDLKEMVVLMEFPESQE